MNPVDNIPAELKSLRQWAIAGDNKAPHVLIENKLYPVSVKEFDSFMTYDEAKAIAERKGQFIGFILTENDPYSCIDLDIKDSRSRDKRGQFIKKEDWTTPDEINRYKSIMEQFDSYTELSKSQTGLHIWVKGDIGQGRRRGGVEIYSRERFIICTGFYTNTIDWHFDMNKWNPRWDTVNEPKPIIEQQVLLNNMAMQLSTIRQRKELVELDPVENDQIVLDRARDASNREKFDLLWSGNWQQGGFPSQSEADLALMSMFTFYSESNEQCRRLFRMSSLGKRDKARKDNRHLDYMLTVIRSREAEEKETLAKMEMMAKQMVEQSKTSFIDQNLLANALTETISNAMEEPIKTRQPSPADQLAIEKQVQINMKLLKDAFKQQDMIVEVPKHEPSDDHNPEWFEKLPEVLDDGLPWPPGMAGEIAAFVYFSSPRPVREIAITAALGVLSGICGKAWNIPGSGLNMYIVLICQSAIGKEALHQGPAILERQLEPVASDISKMIDPTNYVSGPAIRKAALSLMSTCNFQSEFGRKLKRMADERDNIAAEMRTTMTELYQKSAAEAKVGGVAHSNKDHNVEAKRGIAYSMVGESTPDTFYESLTDSMMEDGFLSRFSIVEYDGQRPPHNEYANTEVKNELITCMTNMINDATIINAESGNAVMVGITDEVKEMSRKFSQEMDDLVNDVRGGGKGETDQSKRQMYNRAHLKFLRLSALLSVATFYGEGNTVQDGIPVIRMREAKWALDFVRSDIRIMSAKLKAGLVGLGESARNTRIKAIIKAFMDGTYNLSDVQVSMRAKGCIPYEFIVSHARRSNCFSKARQGAAKAVKETLYEFIDCGVLAEMTRTEVAENFGVTNKSYRILVKLN